MQTAEITDSHTWDAYVNGHAFGHPLQLWGWGELKRLGGWWPYRLFFEKDGQVVGGAQVLMLSIPGMRRRVAYTARGPILDPKDIYAPEVITALAQFCQKQHALFLTIEPAWESYRFEKRWLRSRQNVLLDQTDIVDLSQSIQQIMANMRPKTRQYIRKAESERVKIIRDGSGQYFEEIWHIYQITSKRAKFALHAKEYYHRLYQELGAQNHLYIALVASKPEAFLWVATAGQTAFELYGGVTPVGAESKANYLLKMRSIADMRALGLKTYDFNGRLNEGINQFKAGFGPKEVDYIGSYDLPFSRGMYALWHSVMPLAKGISRRVRTSKTIKKASKKLSKKTKKNAS